MISPSELLITKQILNSMYQDSLARFPTESCGFIIGSGGYFTTVCTSYATVNVEGKTNRYTIEPYDFYKVEKSLESSNLTIVGFYHSHPNGSPRPSHIDIQLAWYGYSYLIISLTSSYVREIKSWIINSQTGECVEQPIIIM